MRRVEFIAQHARIAGRVLAALQWLARILKWELKNLKQISF